MSLLVHNKKLQFCKSYVSGFINSITLSEAKVKYYGLPKPTDSDNSSSIYQKGRSDRCGVFVGCTTRLVPSRVLDSFTLYRRPDRRPSRHFDVRLFERAAPGAPAPGG